MWLLVVSRSSDYWLGLSPRVTHIALVCPWRGPVEGVGGMLVFFLPLLPYLVEISFISSWFWAITCCKSSAVTAICGAGSLGGALLTMFAWFWNSAERRLTISSTIFACPYPASSRVSSLVSVISRWDYRKWVLNAIHILWIGRRQLQDLMDYQNVPVLLRML